MKNNYKSTQGNYIFTYSEGIFKVSNILTPEIYITQTKTDKINSEKDFQKEVMWQQASINDQSEYDSY
mgnify:CR=1 FL=1|tara:strand:+ start:588 stop:791 length:204 start_codon:yes stop_codon:yes gene_type:complete